MKLNIDQFQVIVTILADAITAAAQKSKEMGVEINKEEMIAVTQATIQHVYTRARVEGKLITKNPTFDELQ